MNEYDNQAAAFLNRFGFRLKIDMKGERCPIWGHDHGCQHGDHYRVTLRRISDNNTLTNKRSLCFDFWGSQSIMWNGELPRPYDILASISSEATCSTDPDEVAEEFGDIKPTQAIAIARFARRLQGFFTEAEREALAEIS